MDDDVITLEDLGVTEDPGTMWHPRDRAGARNAEGDLVDLSEEEVEEHMSKPESADQPDAGRLLDHDGEDEGLGEG